MVVIPTYNEKENIKQLIPRILDVSEDLRERDENLSILVVDDNSPDGTARVVKNFSGEREEVNLLERKEKNGLGNAYVDGFEYSIKDLKAEVLIEMDGDMSHDPSVLPNFIREIKRGSDLVIGSRRVSEGETVGWSLRKNLASWMGNFLARIVTGFRVEDCTSGYRAIRSSLLEDFLQEIDSEGYAIQLEIVYHAVKNDAKITEIPITFEAREKGQSKMRKDDLIEFTKRGLRLGLKG